ncbi:MAG TPA: hypothetical protein VLB67_06775 [Acidimicrobiia bacterium]|nr:hypothetical protein [Acidimicrobiia bacterium]
MDHTEMTTLEKKVESLDRAVNRLERQVADTEMAGWESRIEQLRLEATLARMAVEDEAGEGLEKVRAAYEAARRELEDVPELVGEALAGLGERLRPAFDKIEKAYREARRNLL